MSFDDAKAYCQSLEDGLAGWRLPTIDELKAQIVGCDPVTDCEVSTTCVECPCGDDLDTCRPPSACAYLEGPGPAGCYWDNAFETACTGGLNQEHYVWSSTAAVTPEGGASCSSEYWSVNFAEAGIAGIQDHFGMMVMCVK